MLFDLIWFYFIFIWYAELLLSVRWTIVVAIPTGSLAKIQSAESGDKREWIRNGRRYKNRNILKQLE